MGYIDFTKPWRSYRNVRPHGDYAGLDCTLTRAVATKNLSALSADRLTLIKVQNVTLI
jgi:hypothetical protein